MNADDWRTLAHRFDTEMARPGWAVEPDLPLAEYRLRLARARERMREERLDALVITSSSVGGWFTGRPEPDEWHDQCQSRANFFVLTGTSDHLFMAPTVAGERLSSVRRRTWVSEIVGVVESSRAPRSELWDIEQLPHLLADIGLASARIGFELGEHTTLGMSVLDFLRLRELLPRAELVDGSAVVRWLMSHLTPFEVDRLRKACAAGAWVHAQVPRFLRVGLTERQLAESLAAAMLEQFPEEGYRYDTEGGWSVGTTSSLPDPYHVVPTNRPYQAGDLVFRGVSGAVYRGYAADIDRDWYLGEPPAIVHDWYRMAWESNQAMAAALRPGVTAADVYAAGAAVEARFGLWERVTGRTGHGYRNTGGLSVFPGCRTVLEPGMVISVEPIYHTPYGQFDLEDQYLITETGAECLHEPAPEQLPVVDA